MWWEPTYEHFETFDNPQGPVRGLGKLSDSKTSELQSSVSSLMNRLETFQKTVPSSSVSPLIGPLRRMIEHGLVSLRSIWTNFRQMAFGVRNVQRCWLELFAILEWMTVYKPIMDGAASSEPAVAARAEVTPANTIGAFTSEVRIAQYFYLAGLPVWLIRPASEFVKVNILEVASIIVPDDHIIVGAHQYDYPVLFHGPATSEKFNAIYAYARNSLRYPDFFQADDEVALSPALPTVLTTAKSSGELVLSGAATGPSRRQTTTAARHGTRNKGGPNGRKSVMFSGL
jgi:hypothetical protein